jgi:hypothetical protein
MELRMIQENDRKEIFQQSNKIIKAKKKEDEKIFFKKTWQ